MAEMLGEQGLWWKSTMFESAVTVRSSSPVATCRPVESSARMHAGRLVSDARRDGGRAPSAEDADLPGRSLVALAREPDTDRQAFKRVHAIFSRRGTFMLRLGRWKYVHHVDGPPELFDLDTDPDELLDSRSIRARAYVRSNRCEPRRLIASGWPVRPPSAAIEARAGSTIVGGCPSTRAIEREVQELVRVRVQIEQLGRPVDMVNVFPATSRSMNVPGARRSRVLAERLAVGVQSSRASATSDRPGSRHPRLMAPAHHLDERRIQVDQHGIRADDSTGRHVATGDDGGTVTALSNIVLFHRDPAPSISP